MTLARMPGRAGRGQCPYCRHGHVGPDCPDDSRTPKQVRLALKRELRREVFA